MEWVQDWVRCGERCGELGDSFKENKTVRVAHCQKGRVSGGDEQEGLGSCWEAFSGEREQSMEDKSGFSRRAVSVTLGWGGWPGGPAPAVGYCAFASKSHSFSLLPGQERDRAGLAGEWGGDRWRLAHLRAQMATPSSRGLRMIEHHACTHTRRAKKEFTRPFILQLRKWRPRGQHWSSQEPTSEDSVWSEVSVGSEMTGFVEERGDTWFHAFCVGDQRQHPRHSAQRFRGRKVSLGLQSVAAGWFQGTGRGGEAGLGPTGCSCPLPALPKEQSLFRSIPCPAGP